MQFEAFTRGFMTLCGGPAIHLFSATELERLVCGNPQLDFDRMQANARYDGGYSPEHRVCGCPADHAQQACLSGLCAVWWSSVAGCQVQGGQIHQETHLYQPCTRLCIDRVSIWICARKSFEPQTGESRKVRIQGLCVYVWFEIALGPNHGYAHG